MTASSDRQGVSNSRITIENTGVAPDPSGRFQTNDAPGDGTTTATVPGPAMVKAGPAHVAAGANAINPQKGHRTRPPTFPSSKKKIEEHAKPISDSSTPSPRWGNTISAGNDEEWRMIADAMDKVGKEGVISWKKQVDDHRNWRSPRAMRFDKGYISPYFAPTPSGWIASSRSPTILLTDKEDRLVPDLVLCSSRYAAPGKAPC